MKVAVKLISLSAQNVAGVGKDGTGHVELSADNGLMDLVSKLGLPKVEPYVILLNGAPVPASERATKELNNGDEVVFFPPIEGG